MDDVDIFEISELLRYAGARASPVNKIPRDQHSIDTRVRAKVFHVHQSPRPTVVRVRLNPIAIDGLVIDVVAVLLLLTAGEKGSPFCESIIGPVLQERE